MNNDLEETHKKEIEKIIGQMHCTKDFQCYRSGFAILARAKDVGMSSYVQCLEENPGNCPFLVHIPDACYCECPLRVYIAKELKK